MQGSRLTTEAMSGPSINLEVDAAAGAVKVVKKAPDTQDRQSPKPTADAAKPKPAADAPKASAPPKAAAPAAKSPAAKAPDDKAPTPSMRPPRASASPRPQRASVLSYLVPPGLF